MGMVVAVLVPVVMDVLLRLDLALRMGAGHAWHAEH
jgi:hypothetical protein